MTKNSFVAEVTFKRFTQRQNKKIHDEETMPILEVSYSLENSSEYISEHTLLSVGLIVFKYSCISFCLISPLRIFC